MNAFKVIYRFILPYRRQYLQAVAITLICTVISLSPPLIVKAFVDRVIGQREESLLTPLLVLFVLIPLLAEGLRAVNGYMITMMGSRLVLDMRRRLYGHLQHLPLRFFDSSSTGAVMERLMGDVGQVQGMVTHQTVTIATDLLGCVVALGAMLWLNARLALIPLMFIPLYVLTHRYFRARLRRAFEQYRSKIDEISGTVSERLRSTPIVKAFGQERTETRRFTADAYDAQGYGVRAYNYAIGFNTAASLQTWSARVGILLLGYYMVIHGAMTLGEVVAFGAYSVYLLGPAVRFAGITNMVETVMVSVRRIGELLDEPTEVADAPDAVRVRRLRGEVDFHGVGFEYEADQPVLQDIDLHVPAGSTIALVGHTGCGKTTMISLLYRFYEVTSGAIVIDGHDVRRIARTDLRRNLSLVPQDPVIFETTVSENIAYGCPDAPLEKIVEAARIAELYDEIMELPDGFETRLGGADAKLSVGQKQRLMIARAVLSDPAILILDEATSSLDGESERALQEALDRVMAGRTSFVIAHRLSTIVNADLIVVLDEGRIIEVGTHRKLLDNPEGHYRQLYLQQFAKVA
jgi:ABC-type multidrug transport system fused ATPase/permease subunit